MEAITHFANKFNQQAAQKHMDNCLLCDIYPCLREAESVEEGMENNIQKLVDKGSLTYNKETVNDPSTLKVRASDFSEYDDRDIIFNEFSVLGPETNEEMAGYKAMSAKRRKFVNNPLNQIVYITWIIPKCEKDKNVYSLRAKMTMKEFAHEHGAVLSQKTSLGRMIGRFSGCLTLAPKWSWQNFFNESI